MSILDRLQQWKEQGTLSATQQMHLASLVREEPFSVFAELNLLLYAGVLAFVIGLGWTVSTWSEQLGDLVVVSVLSAILAAGFWYCFSRAAAWLPAETPATNLLFDYVLYLCCLVWCIELAYLEKRLHLLSGQWDVYLLITAILFLLLAYRFDNRFVLSLAFSSLAGWFGLTISHLPFVQTASYRNYALLFCLLVGAAGMFFQRLQVKPHFFNTYLNIVANVLFCALLAGVFEKEGFGSWFVGLLIAGLASLTWGLKQHQFAFVVYAAVYGYVGVSSLLVRNLNDGIAILGYFTITAIVMVGALVAIALWFGRTK